MKLFYLPLFLCYTSAFGLDSVPDDKDNDVNVPNQVMNVYDAEKISHLQQKHLVGLSFPINSCNIYNGQKKTSLGICSASVISEMWIVTSAHCFKLDNEDENIIDIQVTVRRVENNNWVILGKAPMENIIIHEKYVHDVRSPKSQNDIAVVKMMEPLKLDKNLVPIKLHQRPSKQSTTATIAGYGESEYGINYPRQGKVTVSTCSSVLGTKLLCSNNIVRAGSGDSGGPLISKRGTLLGVTSSGCIDVHIRKACLTVYVEVYHYLDWIKAKTGVV